ncbi:MAG: DUF5684 domain-containing protein [Verrucomicrobiota bacterium]
MNQRQSPTPSLLIGIWLALLLFPRVGAAADETFALVETKTGVYSNVTVTTKSKDYIVIQHAAGLTSLKVAELPAAVQEKLGFVAPKPKMELGTLAVTAKARALVDAIPATKIEEAWSKYTPAGTPPLELNAKIIGVALGVVAAGYFCFCFCGAMICQKVGRPAGILMWIPVVQLVPLLRAANMSPWWVLGMMVPPLNIWGHIKWSFRIAGARGKGFGTALLLILPTAPLAFIYLAFAGTGNTAATTAALPPEQLKATA